MSLFSTFVGGGGDIPVGDKYREVLTTVPDNTETTVLTVASGGGIFYGLLFPGYGAGSTSNVNLTGLKVTVDGEAERTLTGLAGIQATPPSGGGASPAVFRPVPIKFATSLVVKITIDTNDSSSRNVTAQYSVN